MGGGAFHLNRGEQSRIFFIFSTELAAGVQGLCGSDQTKLIKHVSLLRGGYS